MRIHCIACETLARLVYHAAALSAHVVDITLLPKGLHDRPNELRARLQEAIDRVSTAGYDVVVLGYGLCGRALAGVAARGTPLVAPRAHDCITLFLGSRQRYQQQFESCPGTFWYAQDYMERSGGGSFSMGTYSNDETQAMYDAALKKYGKARADRLLEAVGAWKQHYSRAVYLETGLGDGAGVETRARQEAERHGWRFERLECDLKLATALLAGDWQANEFLTVSPGQQIGMSFDDGVISASP